MLRAQRRSFSLCVFYEAPPGLVSRERPTKCEPCPNLEFYPPWSHSAYLEQPGGNRGFWGWVEPWRRAGLVQEEYQTVQPHSAEVGLPAALACL